MSRKTFFYANPKTPEEVDREKCIELLAVKEWLRENIKFRTNRDILIGAVNKELNRLGYTWDANFEANNREHVKV